MICNNKVLVLKIGDFEMIMSIIVKQSGIWKFF